MPDLFIAKKTKKLAHTSSPNSGLKTLLSMPQTKQRMSLFTTFIKNPSGLTFQDQNPDEKVLLFLRRDFITNVPWIITFVILLILPFLLSLLLSLFFITIPFVSENETIVLSGFYYIIVIGYGLFNFISWFYNIGIITQQRIFDLDYINLTSKSVSLANLASAQDVEYTQNGFLRSFFDYGDVKILIETVGSHIEFLSIPRPAEVADLILDLRTNTHHD